MALQGKVQRGESLTIEGETFNAFLDAAKFTQNQRHGPNRESGNDVYQSTVLLVRNTDAATYDQFSVLGIESPSIAIAANPQHVLEYPIFNASLPVATSEGRFCVIQEPARPGQIVRAVISGCTWCSIVKTTAYDEFCDAAAGVPWLIDSPAGSAQILYHQGAVAGTQFAFVRLWGKIYSRKLIAKAPSGGIAALNTSTLVPGSGAVDIYRKNGSTIEDTGRNLTVFNNLGAVTGNAYIHIGQDAYGVWWVDAEKC